MKQLVAFISIIFLFSSCSNNNIIPINKMKIIVWDLACADDWYATISMSDSTHKINKKNQQLYQQVFAIHKISKQQFYTSYKYYQAHANEFKTLMDSVSAYGNTVRNKLQNNPPTVPVSQKPVE